MGGRQAGDHPDAKNENPDNLRAGELHAAHQDRDGQCGAGKGGAPYAGGDITAGRERGWRGRGVPGGAGADAGQAGGGNQAQPNHGREPGMAGGVWTDGGADGGADGGGV